VVDKRPLEVNGICFAHLRRLFGNSVLNYYRDSVVKFIKLIRCNLGRDFGYGWLVIETAESMQTQTGWPFFISRL
jgi:hypothetical protein